MMLRRLLALVTAFCLLLVASNASAQQQHLTARFDLLSAMVRTDGPIPLVWTVDWSEEELLEGRLKLKLMNGRRQVGQFTTSELVLAYGEQRFGGMLPSLMVDRQQQQLSANISFVSNEGKTFDLGSQPIRISGWGRRTLVIGICDPFQTGGKSSKLEIFERLRLETFDPEGNRRRMGTHPAFVRPDDMPQNGLGCCAFDLVLLADSGFGILRSQRLKALADWVDAGGSLCVIPGDGLGTDHMAFLNELSGHGRTPSGDSSQVVFVLDEAGKLVITGQPEGSEPLLLHKGLGRAVVIPSEILSNENWDEERGWRAISAFLWKARETQWKMLCEEGHWDPELHVGGTDDALLRALGDTSRRGLSVDLYPTDDGTALLSRLMPREFRVLPLGLVGVILLTFVVAIGPADYFFLGMFKLRRFTWITFPISAVGITFFTVWLSDRYMGVSDHRSSITFLDVVDGGKIARTNRFELLFFATRQRNVATAVTGGLFTPLNRATLRYGTRQDDFDLLEFGQTGEARYTGTMPLRYVASQDVLQWSPQINRLMSIAPEETAMEFDWDDVAANDLMTSAGRGALGKRVIQDFGPRSSAYVFHGTNKPQRIAGTESAFGQPMVSEKYRLRGSNDADFLGAFSVRKQQALFAIVSQISPTGGANFEDVTILDPTTDKQWLLVVVVPGELDVSVYRKLYVLRKPNS